MTNILISETVIINNDLITITMYYAFFLKLKCIHVIFYCMNKSLSYSFKAVVRQKMNNYPQFVYMKKNYSKNSKHIHFKNVLYTLHIL